MKTSALVRELLPLAGLPLVGKRRKTSDRVRSVTFAVLVWIPVIAWAITALYRSTVRKDQLLAERDERARAMAGETPVASA